MYRIALALFALLSSTPADSFAGACARPQISTTPLSTVDTELAGGGGVVMLTEDAAKAPIWKFSDGKQHVPAKAKVIGAGLVVFAPPAAGEWTLEDAAGKPVVKVKRAAVEPKVLDAPKLASIKRRSTTGRRGTYVALVASVAGAVPKGAIALVVLDQKDPKATKVRSWGKVDAATPATMGAKTHPISVFTSGSCTVSPNGTVDSQVGDKVAVAWIDTSGRLSPATAATVVVEPSTPSNIGE